MSTEIQPYDETGSALSIASEQTAFTPDQLATLRHMGVEGAPEEDLRVFFHACKRSGLDPFQRQIYMICRQETFYDENDNRRKRPKWTIQIGIDGFRVIGQRSTRKDKIPVGMGVTEWAHKDGTWRTVWTKEWGYPLAARVSVIRNGQPFEAVALFDEYVPFYNGTPSLKSTWITRYAGQLAKCAEALAWRKACPQDLSGMYSQEEMDRHDVVQDPDPVQPGPPLKLKSLETVKEAVKSKQRPRGSNDIVAGETVAKKIDADQRRQLAAGFTPEAGFTVDPASAEGRADAIRFIVDTLTDKTTGVAPDIKSTADLDEAQFGIVLQAIEDRRRTVAAAPGDVDEQEPPEFNFGKSPSGDGS